MLLTGIMTSHIDGIYTRACAARKVQEVSESEYAKCVQIDKDFEKVADRNSQEI